ncbi:unnamed protein product [Caenorhabditis sp. 36 PRJEB53466]|nr:unnamed protein product [Caenorhabditis sp. 36 PRJEB53466]
MVLICSLALLLAVERYFATIWVSTYEMKKHKWISIVLVKLNIVAGVIGTLIFHYELISVLLLVALGLSLNVISIFSFITLYNLNRTNLKYCQTREMSPLYTLSFRFQLNENLKIMKWLKNSIVVMAALNMTLAGFLIVSNDEYLRNNNQAIVKHFHTFFNFAIAVYGQILIFVFLLADRNFRRLFLRFDLIRMMTKPFFGRVFPEDFRSNSNLSTNDETNVYFTSLSSQWDDQMRRKSMDILKKVEAQNEEKKKKKRRSGRRRIFPKRSTNEDN